MNKHTQGPWYAWHNESGIGVGRTDGNESDIAHCDGFDSDRSVAEEKANAVLIAAAPDLLHTLQVVADTLPHVRMPEETRVGLLSRIKKALEKATGEIQ